MLNRDYIWLINGTEVYVSSTPSPFEYHFDSAGVYTIGLVIRAGACKDTLTKIDYVTVLPPFPDIKSALNTCDGTRGSVLITDATRGTASWNWSFGDGKSLNYSSFTKNINHTYTKSGSYKVKLTATTGNCTVTDSINVNVLLKQKPLLTAESSSVCTSDSLFINLSNFELHPIADSSSQPYLISRLQFKDLTTSNATINAGKWSTSVRTGIYGLESGKEDIRIITTSHYFQCEDTSNFAKLKIAGPIADFAFNPQQCFNAPVILQDKSVAATGSPITKWEWFYGDSTGTVALNGNSISHQYKLPGTYQLSLRVTDAGGCVYQTPADSAHKVNLTGPAAFFEASGYHVPVNSTVNFINKSIYFQNSELLWHFSDGSVSANTNPSFFYNSEGDYKVMLITKNLLSGCTDTAENIIYVKKFQSLFTYTATYINQNNCPPVIVNFKSESINANKVSWTFGDGGEAGNQVAVEHVYTNPGLYRIVHYSYDSTGRIDSAIQIFEVKGPYATITADTSYACNALQVRLSADTINASSFKWDFGDGTIAQTTDTFATHLYTVPGVYTPGLILSDPGGCNAISQLDKKIIIDSLAVKISALPDAIICDSSLVSFTSSVYSLAEDTLGKAPQFLWTSGMHLNQPQATRMAAWYFDKKGVHDVTLEVRSNYGCKEVITKQVVVKQGVTAGIKVPKVLCSGDSILFEGIATPAAGTMQWHWQFAGNRVSDLQYPPGIIYATSGLQPVSLIVNNGFCADTAYALADILNRPTVSLLASKPYLCEGDSAMLSASGGVRAQWTPAFNSASNNGLNVTVQPLVSKIFTATITDSAGCSSKDSIQMKVINPLTLKVVSPVVACPGYNVQLLAAGANTYQWNGNGLNSTASNPYVTANAAAVYQVIGYDAFNCFSDTAAVELQVMPLPSVQAGPDQKVIAGQEVTLVTTSTSDVVKWNWQPGDYLKCTNCPSPVSRPESSINYVVTVTNNAGCIATDTVRVEMICGSELIYVPTGFTPNGDNLNDRFAVHGSGIKIKRLAIFNRWGMLVFERKDISPYDRSSSWDGTYKGEQMSSGSYVYMLEAVCERGEAFTFKGMVTLIR
jgi:gliding motility-associated-like protein